MDTKAFSTRTERRTKDNPHLDGVHIIGLDMGYSGPKCVHEKGNFVFPNFCKELEGDIFQELSKNDLIYEDITTGKRYIVGEMATKSLSQDTVVPEDILYSQNHYLHPDFLITFRTALGLALWDTPTDGHDVFLQTGLPPEYMLQGESYLRTVVEQRHVFTLQAGNEKKTFDITLKHNQVDIMYQPMGTFYSVVFDTFGNLTKEIRDYMSSDVLIFDGGFKTLDEFMVQGKQLQLKKSNGNLGMKRVLEEARNQIQNDWQTYISIPAMQNCLRTGTFQVKDIIMMKNDSYSIEPYLENANQLVREMAFDSIKEHAFKVKFLVMTGGTGAAWYDYFKDRLKGLSSLKVISGGANSSLPVVYSNARGYYFYRLQQLREQRQRG